MRLIKWIRDTYLEDEIDRKEDRESANLIQCSEYDKNKAIIPTISIEKRLLCAVAAPLRITTFGDWFTMQKEKRERNDHFPLHLHTFGSDLALTEVQEKQLSESLERDFQVTDRLSALQMCEEINHVNWKAIKEKVDKISEEAGQEGVHYLQQTEMGAVYALLLAASGHSLTASVDLGYLTEREALETVEEMMDYFPLVFEDWKEYSDRFMDGSRRSVMNLNLNQRILKRHLKNLHTKAGSPWQWLSINEVNQLKWIRKTTRS